MIKVFPKGYNKGDDQQVKKVRSIAFHLCILYSFGRSPPFNTGLKQGFSPRITIPDQLALEGAETPNFQSLGIFHMFPEKFGA